MVMAVVFFMAVAVFVEMRLFMGMVVFVEMLSMRVSVVAVVLF